MWEATTVLGRVLAESMLEVIMDQMGVTVDQMEVTNGSQLIQYLYPITKHRTSEGTGFR